MAKRKKIVAWYGKYDNVETIGKSRLVTMATVGRKNTTKLHNGPTVRQIIAAMKNAELAYSANELQHLARRKGWL